MVEYKKGNPAQEGVMATASLIFKRISIKDEALNNLLQKIVGEGFRADKGQGYHVTEMNEDYIFAYYIYSFITSMNIFDESENDFKSVKFEQQEFAPFCLDFKNKMLVVFGNKMRANRVIEALGAASDYSISIDDIQIDPAVILETIKKQNIIYFITKVKVKDIEFSENVICDCTFKFVNSMDSSGIIKKYSDKIIQYTIHIDLPDDYSITIYRNGAISIYKDFTTITIDDVRLFYPALIL